ncbi:steroid receptor RNA activator (SRA1) domain-containing protein [Hirsutella rhossiliensis]|uniref:Protein transport protein SEC31 n=1 Tax=Hirsutella rhossiliensis TaxID=111463 RepID=A0A9P8N9E8_9HYPO|nr:steroid receptor RNA activator (SRA1) domain-containing protein [Hirsutella rhossiliensis]KAH0967047.1 steroid receptor RNA activator (SRA1) domain-containing protein [Hirsutella rhossiliensis]
MVRLREVPRTATFAWSPGPGKPLLVTGTRAGAVDADFSDESKLELWDLTLDDQQQGIELQPVISITTESKFYDIAWGPSDSEHPKGIIAGALENGSLELWDAAKLESGASDASISQTTKHIGAIKTLQFNPLKPQILATAGAKGELFIYDVNDIENPFRLGNTAARSDDIDCLAWNRKVSHILATGGTGGFVTVWDLKTKKASLTLNNSRKPVSAIAWDPNNSTKLLTATPDDSTPVILLWDLRNSNAPERTLQGHEQGDNRTLVWNPQTGERYGELPEMTNWAFQTRFNPSNPNLSATASFDGKIIIQTLQNTNPDTSQNSTGKNLDGEDFFSAAQTQPQGASWSLSKAPSWFERPIGASFGFGGKIVVFRSSPAQPGQKRTSKVVISQFSADSDVSSATEKFQEALATGNLEAICEERMQQSKTDEERADWKEEELAKVANGAPKEPADDAEKEEAARTDGEAEETKKGVSDLFAGGDGDGDGDDDDFLSNVAATKGAKTDNPFHLFSDSDTSVEKDITKALMLGSFEKATDICLAEERIADAFLIANCGGSALVDRVQAAYLAQKRGMPSYMRLLGSVIAKNLWDVVYNADLGHWKETMAVLCTFSDPVEFPDLCEALGDRIGEEGQRKDASFCYLVGSKLEKVINIWVAELEEAEQAGMKEPSEDSTFSVHARSLQNFIEKVTIFRHVTKFQDTEKSQESGWKLATLYDKYTEYADILAGHGQLEVAQKYLELLPSSYPAAETAKSRVRMATQKPAAQAPAARQPATSNPAASRAQTSFGYQPAQPPPVASPANPYAAPNPQHPPAPQAQQYMPPQNPYQPQGGFQPPVQPGYMGGMVPPPPMMGGPPRNTTPSQPPPSQARKMENWNDVPLVTKAVPRRSTPSAAPITSPFPGPAPPRVQSPLAGPPQSFQAPPPRPSSTAASQYAPPPPQAGAAGPQMSQAAQAAQRTASPYNAPPPGAPASNRYAPAPSPQQQPGQPGITSLPPPPGPASRLPPANPYGAPPPQAAPQGQYAPSPYAAPPNQPAGPPQGPPPAGPPPMGGGPMPTPPPPKAAAPPPKAKHPPGDRSHIPANAQRMVDILSQDMQRVAFKAAATFAPQVKDSQKRLNILFDHLNNEELVQPATIDQLSQLAEAIQSRDYTTAQKLQVDIQRDKTEECGNWMVGVKRLISMSKATP